MRHYPKIETLFARDEDFNVTAELKRPVIGTISKWIVTEKIDGTNVRIAFVAPQTSDGEHTYTIAGRTDNAQFHVGLFNHVDELARRVQPKVIELMEQYELASLTLYGEGFGEKIQSGGDYRKGQGFILFDVAAGAKWLPDDTVTEIAEDLEIPRVPIIGTMSLDQIVEYVRWGFQSWVAEGVKSAEGVVARPLEPLYDNRGQRLILKLKTGDFTHVKRAAKRNVKALDNEQVRSDHGLVLAAA